MLITYLYEESPDSKRNKGTLGDENQLRGA